MDPFRSRDARTLGLTPSMVRAKSFAHPLHGVTALASAHDELVTRCRAAALVLPDDAVFTHLTAASLRGWWLPRIEPFPVIASTDGDAPHLDRRGIYVRRCAIPPEHRLEVDGLRIASPEWTINELAEDLALLDLVVVIDSALHAGHTTIARLWAATVKGRRGVRCLRQALALADPRSESPWETVLRLVHDFSGIAVEPQHEVRDATGRTRYRLDLWIKGSRRAHEYDGATHLTVEGQSSDLRRGRRLLGLGWERVGFTKADIVEDPDQIVREAAVASGRDPREHSAATFRAHFEESTFTRRGYGRLLRRLRRFERTTSPRRRVAQ